MSFNDCLSLDLCWHGQCFARFFDFSRSPNWSCFSDKNILKKHIRNEVQIMKKQVVKHVFSNIDCCSMCHQIWFPHDLNNFGKRLALVAATCLSSCSGGFRDHLGRIWGACWNDFLRKFDRIWMGWRRYFDRIFYSVTLPFCSYDSS